MRKFLSFYTLMAFFISFTIIQNISCMKGYRRYKYNKPVKNKNFIRDKKLKSKLKRKRSRNFSKKKICSQKRKYKKRSNKIYFDASSYNSSKTYYRRSFTINKIKLNPLVIFFYLFMIIVAEKSKCEYSLVESFSVDTCDMQDLFKYIDNQTLVIFDIDGVVMVPTQTLGCDPWSYYEGDKFIKKYGNIKKGLRQYWPTWVYVQQYTDVERVDENLPKILGGLEEKNIPILGFTARGIELVNRTKVQLNSIEIDLAKNAFYTQSLYSTRFVYEAGILFMYGGFEKGDILNNFFEEIGKKPNKIVFLDDRKNNIESLKKMCAHEKISFVGMRYGGADYIIERFDEKKKLIADVQLHYLKKIGRILSDREAEEKIVRDYCFSSDLCIQ